MSEDKRMPPEKGQLPNPQPRRLWDTFDDKKTPPPTGDKIQPKR